MGATKSSEAHGCKCKFCDRALPANNFDFIDESKVHNWFIFYDKSKDKVKYFKYCRKADVEPLEYYCMDCIHEGKQGKKSWEDMLMLLTGKGMIYLTKKRVKDHKSKTK